MPTELDSLRTFLRRTQTASLLVAASLDGQITVQRLTLHQNIARDFIDTARTAVPDDPHLLAYDPGYKSESDDLLHISMADVEGAEALVKDLQRVDQEPVRVIPDLVLHKTGSVATRSAGTHRITRR